MKCVCESVQLYHAVYLPVQVSVYHLGSDVFKGFWCPLINIARGEGELEFV